MRLSLPALPVAAMVLIAPVQAQPQGERFVVQLKDGWRFIQDDTLKGAESPDYSDRDWATVSVPHSWNRVGYYIPHPEAHLNHPETIRKAQGVGWYRLAFTPPSVFRGKRAWLQFEAASRTAKVWLNGTYLGEHAGGFSRFRLDATAALRPGAANLLVVKVDNTKPAPAPAPRPQTRCRSPATSSFMAACTGQST